MIEINIHARPRVVQLFEGQRQAIVSIPLDGASKSGVAVDPAGIDTDDLRRRPVLLLDDGRKAGTWLWLKANKSRLPSLIGRLAIAEGAAGDVLWEAFRSDQPFLLDVKLLAVDTSHPHEKERLQCSAAAAAQLFCRASSLLTITASIPVSSTSTPA